MCTFFVRSAAFAVLLAGCSGHAQTSGSRGHTAPRADTIRVSVPVIRLTTTDSANGSAPLDSATLQLLERRVMSRVASLLRAETRVASQPESDGVLPVKNAAPQIRHGLLGTITFNEDGSIEPASRERIAAIAQMLKQIDAPLEIRSTSELGMRNVDVAIARARRVYIELTGLDKALADRDVSITIASIDTLHPINPAVEIFWRGSGNTAY